MTAFESGAATDVGQVRAHNEDTFVVAGSVFVVADGMGGHNGGEVASQLAVDRLAGIGPVSVTATGATKRWSGTRCWLMHC